MRPCLHRQGRTVFAHWGLNSEGEGHAQLRKTGCVTFNLVEEVGLAVYAR